MFVGLGGRGVDREMQPLQTTLYTAFGSSRVQQRHVRVRADSDSLLGRVGDHVKEPWVHKRFAESLQVQLTHGRELVNQSRERVEGHESQRSVRRPVLAEWNRTHLTAEITLSHRLNLQERRKVHNSSVSGGD